MSKSIEPSLALLVPSLNGAFPPQLTDLAASLLTQSRHRASALKSEEEIARPYACAHIACERLKTILDLPPINHKPPIPPRIYTRLHTYLDKILPSSVPSSLKTPSKARSISATGTPDSYRSTRPNTGRFGAYSFGTPTKSTGRATTLTSAGAGLPPWIHPTIRYICQKVWTARSTKPEGSVAPASLAPTILAGLEAIAAPGGKRTSDPWIINNWTPLVAAITLLVRARQSVILHGGELEEAELDSVRREISKALARARVDVQVGGGRMDEEEAWEGYEAITKRTVEAAVSKILQEQWHNADWYHALDEIHQRMRDGQDTDAIVIDHHDRAVIAEINETKTKKSDSMFQDEWDFLSERRIEETKLWKERILWRITELENSPTNIDR